MKRHPKKKQGRVRGIRVKGTNKRKRKGKGKGKEMAKEKCHSQVRGQGKRSDFSSADKSGAGSLARSFAQKGTPSTTSNGLDRKQTVCTSDVQMPACITHGPFAIPLRQAPWHRHVVVFVFLSVRFLTQVALDLHICLPLTSPRM